MQKLWQWLEGKKTKIGGLLIMLGAILAVAKGYMTVSDGLMVFGAGAGVFGYADKANRHQAQILDALSAISQAKTGGVAGVLRAAEPLLVNDAVTAAKDYNAKNVASLLVLAMLLGAGMVAHAQQPAPSDRYCDAQLPFGMPSPHKQTICRKGYALDYDSTAKIPVWDAHVLTPKHTLGCVPRSNAFAADDSLPAGDRAKPSDYLHAGYDIGHMSPDADFTYDADLERQSFLLTNMAPQLPGLNRQTWKYLEEDIRAWAWGGRTLWIVTGPIYGPRDKTIGDDKVNVPTGFWKVVVDVKTGEYLAFVFPQKEGLGSELSKFLVSYPTLVKSAQTVSLPLPRDARESGDLWDVPSGYNAAKKAACS